MAGFQMPKRGDGAAMLRDLRDEERPPLERNEERPSLETPEPLSNELAADAQEHPSNGHTPVLTETRTYGSTEARTDASEEVSTQGSKDALTDVGTEERKPARKGTRTEGSKEGRAQARTNGSPDILEAVDMALASREPLLGGVKATVDMSPELSTRAKRYLADHRGQNTRQVMVALLDAFLSAKGY